MKKTLALLVAAVLCFGLLAACSSGGTATSEAAAPPASEAAASEAAAPAGDGVELRVVSSFSGTDGNRQIFEDAFRAWEAETGNVVIDESQTSDETWKAKVVADFETGSDPDVLFYFTFADANAIVEAGKVVPLEEIQAAYPDYGSNMNMDSMPISPLDGKAYALPATGFWEGLIVNETVLAEAGVAAPTATTTWDEFLEICQAVKDAGKIPIAASLQQVPHYWFEFCVMNNGGPAAHLTVPQEQGDDAYNAWVAGLNDIKDLYGKGYFPDDTLTASDEETCQYFYDDKAAFLLDGSWKVNQVLDNVGEERLGEFSLSFVPAKGERTPTDIVGGLSMGWYISRKAWDDEAKREACVSFIQALTTDEVVNSMAAGTAVTALSNPPSAQPDDLNALQQSAFTMIQETSSVTAAVQDYITPEAKDQILATDTKLVAAGDITAEQAIDNMMAANKA